MTTIADVNHAARCQDWTQVLTLAEHVDDDTLGAHERVILDMARADALRESGDIDAAEGIYISHVSRERAGAEPAGGNPRALHGLAAIAVIRGEDDRARRLCEIVRGSAGSEPSLALRSRALHARIVARDDIPGACAQLTEALADARAPDSTRAHVRYVLGDLLVRAGERDRARMQLAVAGADARAVDAIRTLADVICAQAGLAATGTDPQLMHALLADISHAERIYAGVGDRRRSRAHLARGMLCQLLGNPRRAHIEYRRAHDLARADQEQLMSAHILLALADNERLAGYTDPAHITRARALYAAAGHRWGCAMSDLVIALGARSRGDERRAGEILAGLIAHMDGGGSPAFGAHDRRLAARVAGGDSGPLGLHFPE